LQILVSLRVFRKESQYFYPCRYRLGLCIKKYLYEKKQTPSILSAIKITIQWNLHLTNPYITKSSVKQTIFFSPVLV